MSAQVPHQEPSLQGGVLTAHGSKRDVPEHTSASPSWGRVCSGGRWRQTDGDRQKSDTYTDAKLRRCFQPRLPLSLLCTMGSRWPPQEACTELEALAQAIGIRGASEERGNGFSWARTNSPALHKALCKLDAQVWALEQPVLHSSIRKMTSHYSITPHIVLGCVSCRPVISVEIWRSPLMSVGSKQVKPRGVLGP